MGCGGGSARYWSGCWGCRVCMTGPCATAWEMGGIWDAPFMSAGRWSAAASEGSMMEPMSAGAFLRAGCWLGEMGKAEGEIAKGKKRTGKRRYHHSCLARQGRAASARQERHLHFVLACIVRSAVAATSLALHSEAVDSDTLNVVSNACRVEVRQLRGLVSVVVLTVAVDPQTSGRRVKR